VDIRQASGLGTRERIPPNNLDAEVSVLGALMIEMNALNVVADFLRPEHFYYDMHGDVYKAALSLSEQGHPIDLITMASELERMKALDRVGGPQFLASLQNSVPTAANVEYYARLVKDAATKRELIHAGGRIANLGFDETISAEQAVDTGESVVFAIAQDRIKKDFIQVKDVLRQVWEDAEKVHAPGAAVPGVPSGFYDLDDRTGGFQKTNLIVIAARPGFGKTSLALNIAQNASVNQKIPVGIFSLEMSEHELVTRLLCSEAKVDSYRLRKGLLKDHEWPRIAQAMGVLSEAPMYIEESPVLTIWEMRTRARRLKAKHEDLGLLVVDYLQLMQGRQTENRVQEISEISRSLKGLARELDIPIIACSQLSREPEKRTDHRPQLSDLRESGSIEQDADIVLFIYRERFYDDNLPDDKRNNAEVIIAKNRNGPLGRINLRFVDEQSKFENSEYRRSLPAPSGKQPVTSSIKRISNVD